MVVLVHVQRVLCTAINCVHFEQFQHVYKMHST